jgi:hypothetical protein
MVPPAMSDQSPKGSAPPLCDKRQASMRFVMEIPSVSEPGHVHLFECATCGKLYFRPESPTAR